MKYVFIYLLIIYLFYSNYFRNISRFCEETENELLNCTKSTKHFSMETWNACSTGTWNAFGGARTILFHERNQNLENNLSWKHRESLVLYKTFHALRPFSDLLCVPYEFYSFLIHPPELSGKYQQRYLVAYQVKLGEKWRGTLLTKSLCHTPQGFLMP
jgi:hypothetical protein